MGWGTDPVVKPSAQPGRSSVLAPPRGTPPSPQSEAEAVKLYLQQPTVAPRAIADLTQAEANAKKAQLELAEAERVANQNKPDTGALRENIVRSIEGVRKAKRLSQTTFAATGAGSDILKGAGWPVNAVKQALAPVTANTALNQIIELKKSGVALTPISDTDIKLLAGSVAGIDTSQPDENFQQAMDDLDDHFTELLKKIDRIPTPEGAKAALEARRAARAAGKK